MFMGEKLKKLRHIKGVSQEVVAKEICVSVSAYANYEQGIRIPNTEIIVNLCKYYKVSADYLLGIEER